MKDWGKLEADVNAILNKHYTKGRGGKKVNKVIVHYNAGNLTVEGCYSVWQTREASAHYQVEDGGRIGQLVWDSDTAWHAGNFPANQTSIGIEHANRSDGTISEACLDNGAHLVAAVCKYFGLGRPEWLKNVFPHKYFAATSCPGQIYGSQKDAYIQRAQKWYDAMTGSGSAPSTSGGSSSSGGSTSAKKTVSQLADEVIAGKWGNGSDRKARLEAAGYDYSAVQAEVNHKLGASSGGSSQSPDIDQMARDVIAGKYGNGDARKKALGSNYDAVQRRVNELLGVSGGSSSTSSTSSSKTWKVGASVQFTSPYDEHGTHLAVSGTYTIMQINGNRIVVGRGGVVTAAVPKGNLRLV